MFNFSRFAKTFAVMGGIFVAINIGFHIAYAMTPTVTSLFGTPVIGATIWGTLVGIGAFGD